MNISPINSIYNTNLRKPVNSRPNFKGALNNSEMDRIFRVLSKNNCEVVENFKIENLHNFIQQMLDRYSQYGIGSIGIQVVSNSDLPKLLGENISKYNTKGKIGLCLAVGDVEGPIECMKMIFEARTLLVDPETLIKHP